MPQKGRQYDTSVSQITAISKDFYCLFAHYYYLCTKLTTNILINYG